jgi:hypothetical protein
LRFVLILLIAWFCLRFVLILLIAWFCLRFVLILLIAWFCLRFALILLIAWFFLRFVLILLIRLITLIDVLTRITLSTLISLIIWIRITPFHLNILTSLFVLNTLIIRFNHIFSCFYFVVNLIYCILFFSCSKFHSFNKIFIWFK